MAQAERDIEFNRLITASAARRICDVVVLCFDGGREVVKGEHLLCDAEAAGKVRVYELAVRDEVEARSIKARLKEMG